LIRKHCIEATLCASKISDLPLGYLQRIHKHRRYIKPGLICDLLEAGWTGDFDVDQAVANDALLR